jgi:hypothetical protein
MARTLARVPTQGGKSFSQKTFAQKGRKATAKAPRKTTAKAPRKTRSSTASSLKPKRKRRFKPGSKSVNVVVFVVVTNAFPSGGPSRDSRISAENRSLDTENVICEGCARNRV